MQTETLESCPYLRYLLRSEIFLRAERGGLALHRMDRLTESVFSQMRFPDTRLFLSWERELRAMSDEQRRLLVASRHPLCSAPISYPGRWDRLMQSLEEALEREMSVRSSS